MNSFVETRGEARKRKNRERHRERYHERQATSRAEKRPEERVSSIPLRVLEMDNVFNEAVVKYATWPQPIKKEMAKRALAEFRDGVALDNLIESPCAVCSALYPKDKWKTVPVEEIDLHLLQGPTNLIEPEFEIDFHYGHRHIDSSGLKVLLDRSGFIYHQDYLFERQSGNNGIELLQSNNEPFDWRICNTCHRHLLTRKTPPLSLANNMWIGPTPPCLQDMTINVRKISKTIGRNSCVQC
jgi:hypothetical protein